MKKVLTLFLSAAMLFPVICFGGCGNGDAPALTDTDTDVTSTEAPDTTEEDTAPEPVKTLTVDNMDEWVKFNGRTYVNNTEKSVHFDWSLGGFEINFVGTGVRAELCSSLGASPDKNTMVYVFIDGNEDTSSPIWLNKKSEVFTLCEGLPEGEHTLKLVKRNCVSKASAGVKMIEVLGSEKATFTEKPAKKDILIEFIGDSITSGDGVFTPGGKSDWISVCQDATCSYAYYIARAFDADVNLVSRCGAGIVWNSSGNDFAHGGIPLPSVYDYCCKYYDSESKWDFVNNQPDLIVINLGTNDRKQIQTSASDTNAANKARWMKEYEAFVIHVRELNPDVPIICTYGAMISASYDLGLEDVVSKLTAAGMKDVYYLRVPTAGATGVGGHPTDKAQKAVATTKYIPFIKNLFPDWAK